MPNSKLKIQSPKLYFSFSALLVFILSIIWLNSNSANNFRTNLKHLLLDELIRISPPAPGTKVDVIYVLGGSQNSLEYKYKTAAGLFRKGICKKIWILSRLGKTKYSPSLGRNLTNDEWSILTLNEFGVPKEHIEPIKMKEGFFGTFSEAKGISSLIKSRGYKEILLISTIDHTHRAKISFENFLINEKVSVYAQSYGEDMLLRNLLVEWVKLKVYQYFLIEKNI